jgi:hypothetical protein
LFGAALYGCMKLGTYLANLNREPENNEEDQTHNPFVN